MSNDYTTIKVVYKKAVARVTIDHPPLNVLDAALMTDLDRICGALAQDLQTRVVIFDSADADFFVPHGDMSIVSDPDSFASLPIAQDQPIQWNPMMRLHERIRKLPQVTIGVLHGLARGGGSELLTAMDMRFASLEHAGLAQMEAPTGIIPGAGGTAYLPRLVGRARTLEIVLGARLIDATTAERWGWINRALPDAELDSFVDALAADIAALPNGVVAAAKVAVDAAADSIEHGLTVENEKLGELFANPIAARLTQAALDAGAQTRKAELDLESILTHLRRLTSLSD